MHNRVVRFLNRKGQEVHKLSLPVKTDTTGARLVSMAKERLASYHPRPT
jgi:hypothetical protein